MANQQISYTTRDFQGIRQELINYVKQFEIKKKTHERTLNHTLNILYKLKVFLKTF